MDNTKTFMPWQDPARPLDERIADLISRLTLEEKVSQMTYNSQAIPRLGIPEYNWWSECLHGVARAGRATVFPQAIGLAATFDTDLIFRVATAISDEGRAKFEAAVKNNHRARYRGLSFWTPNINIFRDPRWGRGQETYGEDPFLTSQIGIAFVKGLQGDHPRYLKAAACAKHYAVHSGPEGGRHHFNAVVSQKDLWETYLPAFEALVEAGVEAVMGAYNRTLGEPCCGSKLLLMDILRGKWGFEGHIVSDCWALVDFHQHHKVTSSPVESAALAINNGCNLNCGNTFPHLVEAVKQGLVTEETINKSLAYLLRTRFKLGLFDPPEMNPFRSIGPEVINCEKHRQLAYEAAVKSIILLKNKANILPLKKDLKSIYVMGPNATSVEVLLGNYFGISRKMSTIIEGITAKVSDGTAVQYRQGFLLDRENPNPIEWAIGEASEADAVLTVMGISNTLEGEEGDAIASDYKGDRADVKLPQCQIDFLKKLREKCKQPIIAILTGGSPIAIQELEELADAILFVWYPGEAGGTAVADILFGDVVPSGRLPITFPKSIAQLPPYQDYAMPGRTYRYMSAEPLYPFGFGLSYTRFKYDQLKLSQDKIKPGDSIKATVTVTNTGTVAAEEVVQLYLKALNAPFTVPFYALKGFQRLHLTAGESKAVSFNIEPEMMTLVDENGESRLLAGKYKIIISGAAPHQRSIDLGAAKPVEAIFKLE